ncbi:MAG: hypothetical protein ABIH09_02525 [Candidatus Omnitrophota bacterium]
MNKIKYELDPYNRFTIQKTDKKTRLLRFREVISGRFRIGKDNSLTYQIKKPDCSYQNIPHQLKIQGKWSLTKKHELCFTVDKQSRKTFGHQLILKGEVLDVNRNSLFFAVKTRTKRNTDLSYVLTLKGIYNADKNNRLTFKAQRERGVYDILTFDGAWTINSNHQIVYEYQKACLKTKVNKIHTLLFKGWWDIKDRARISYILDKKTGSGFDFTTSLGVFRDNCIKYEAAVKVSTRLNPVKRMIILTGTWKLLKNAGITFEIESAAGKWQSISFSADAKIARKHNIELKLKNFAGTKNLDAKLIIKREMLEGAGQAFFEFLKMKKETAVFVGMGCKW